MHAWFMFDNHTFDKIEIGDRDAMIARVLHLFERDGCGSCFIKDGEATFGNPSLWSASKFELNGYRMPDGHWGVTRQDAERWVDILLEEYAFRKLMVA